MAFWASERSLLKRPYRIQIDRPPHFVVIRISIVTSEVLPEKEISTDLVISPHFETQKVDILWLITVQNELITGISS